LLQSGVADSRVGDAAGHHRSHYPGLLLYAWRPTLALVASFLTPDQASGWAAGIERWARSLPTVEEPAGAAWSALASDGPQTTAFFQASAQGQQSSGALLQSDPSQNPETVWYNELVLLHALAAYAVRTGRSDLQPAVLRAAEYHLNETQPDHATSEPWGLLAFVLNPDAHSLADQMLHTVKVLHPNGAAGVTAILLADVLDGLRELDRLSG
jgi:hypothetical protein